MAMSMQQHWTRAGVMVGTTTVLADPGGVGLFAPSYPLDRASFIGAYEGTRWWQVREDVVAPYRGKDDYVMQVVRAC